MASKTTLNAKNLEALGVERLAALLIEISTGDANAKRRLRFELAGVESPDKLISEIRKRLTSIGAATTSIGWRSLKAFKADLRAQRHLISDQLAQAAPAEALDLMWQFIGLGEAFVERTTDASGEVIEIFREACDDIARIAHLATPDRDALVARVAEAERGNGYGQNDRLIRDMAPVLGPDGLVLLRGRLVALAAEPEARRTSSPRKVSKWRRSRQLHREGANRRSRALTIHLALQDIADALGDVDAYIALQTDKRSPAVATDIADRLLKADRPADALSALDAATASRTQPFPVAWQKARVEALEALGRKDDAQAFRLDVFHRTLNPEFLRAYIKRLPDFDDIEAEDEALDYAAGVKDVHVALAFLIGWPAVERAARMVVERAHEIDGDQAEILTAAADRLIARYPLATLIVLRKQVEAIIANAHVQDYGHAADLLTECERLEARLDTQVPAESQGAFLTRLRAGYGRRFEFWKTVDHRA